MLQKRLVRDTVGIVNPNGYSIPYSIMGSSKRCGKKKEKGMFGVMAFVLPVTCDEALNSWIWQNTHLPTGHNALVPCSAVQFFLYLINCLYLDTCFLPFALPISPTLVSG